MARSLKSQDPRGGHTRLYWDIQDSMAWHALGFSSVALYVAMRRKLKQSNNGNIEATIATMRLSGFSAKATLSKALRELQAVGLIAMTRQGGIARGTKVCSLYCFTDVEVFEMPKQGVDPRSPTNEWRRFKTLADAEKAIQEAHEGAKRSADKNTSCVQKLNAIGSKTEPYDESIGSEIEQDRPLLVQELNQSARTQKASNPHEIRRSLEMYDSR